MLSLVFALSLSVLAGMIALKSIELKAGKRFLISRKLRATDTIVVPKLTAFYLFLTGTGEKTLLAHLREIPLWVGKAMTRVAVLLEEQAHKLRESSRGKYTLKNGHTPRTEFLKTIIDYKNGEKKENTEEDKSNPDLQ